MSRPIVFDGGILAHAITGVGRSLLTTLRAYVPTSQHPCILLLPPEAEAPQIDGLRIEPGPARFLERNLHLPGILRKLNAGLLHSPVAALPWRSPCPMIATVHDLPWMAEGLYDEPGCGSRHRRALVRACRRAAAVIVPSQATEADLLAYTGKRPRTNLRVVPHGVEAPETPAPEIALDGPLLVLGDNRPRKNLDRIYQANQLAGHRQADLPALMVIGPSTRYVSEEEKVSLLRGARALVQLSLFEGFGLPIVEAFNHGVPVLCSDRGSLPEIAGGAAMICDPTDVGAMAEAMIEIHVNAPLRHELREMGLVRARAFTPEQSAAGWAKLHGEILA